MSTTEASAGGASPGRGVRGALGMAALASGPLFVAAMLTVVIPILPNITAHLHAFGGKVLSTQLFVASPMLGLVLGGFLSTVIFRWAPARTVLLAGVLVFGLAGAAGVVLVDAPLVLARLVMGLSGAVLSAASTALVGERVSFERRPRVLGLQMASSSVAAIVLMLLSGQLSDHFGWRTSFLIFPALSALVILVGLGLTRSAFAPGAGITLQGRDTLWSILVKLWPVYLFVVVVNVTAFTTNSQASFILAGVGAKTASVRAQIMSLNQVMIVAAAIAFAGVRRLIGQRFIAVTIVLIMGSGLVWLGLANTPLLAIGALALLGTGNGLLFPYQSSLLLSRAPPTARGAAAGIMVSGQFMADAVNPILLAPLIASIGLQSTVSILGGLAIVAALLGLAWVLIAPYRPQDDTAGAGPVHH